MQNEYTTESFNTAVADYVRGEPTNPAAVAERLAGQLRHATKLAAVGDDMTAVYRRLGHAFRHLSDNLHQLAQDTLTGPGGNWVPTPPRLDGVRVGDYVLHSTRGPIRIEHMEADGDELVFVYDTDRRVPARQCVRVLNEDDVTYVNCVRATAATQAGGDSASVVVGPPASAGPTKSRFAEPCDDVPKQARPDEAERAAAELTERLKAVLPAPAYTKSRFDKPCATLDDVPKQARPGCVKAQAVLDGDDGEPGCEYAKVRLGNVRPGDCVMHRMHGPFRVERIEADGNETVFVCETGRVHPRDCVRVLGDKEAAEICATLPDAIPTKSRFA